MRRRRFTSHVSESTRAKLAVLLIGAFIISGVLTRIRRDKLSRLPVPTNIPTVSYSGPLTLSSVSRSVLGAATIDPIDFVNEINKERDRVGSPELRLNATLMKAASMRVKVIMDHQNFSHQDPYEGIELGTVLPKLNYHFVFATENIGMGGVSAPDFVNGFMHSHSHRENLLDPRLTETGAAIQDGPYQSWYVNVAVQLFAIPGGKDEMRGYTDSDRDVYEQSLAELSIRLHPLVWTLNELVGTRGYSSDAKHNLIRQKQILEMLLTKMRTDEQLQSRDVALIIEYNSLL